jgi:hypothetical protein
MRHRELPSVRETHPPPPLPKRPNVYIGLLLRDKNVHNPSTASHWTTSLLFSLIQELVPLYNAADDTLESGY